MSAAKISGVIRIFSGRADDSVLFIVLLLVVILAGQQIRRWWRGNDSIIPAIIG